MTTLRITHTHLEGSLVEGLTRNDKQAHAVLKANRWRYSKEVGWYIRGSRDRDGDQLRLNQTAEALRLEGYEVTVHVDNTPRAASVRIEDKAARAADRSEALSRRAARLQSEGEQHDERARQTASMIPLGQPILVGHHSERRHRRDLERIERDSRKARERIAEAEDAQRRAKAAERNAAGKDIGATRRKIDMLSTEARSIARKLAGATTDEYRLRLEGRAAAVADELRYWQKHLAELEAAGGKVWGPEDFQPGDRVNGVGTVIRVNAKSLTVRPDVFAHTMRMGYDAVRTCERPEG